MLTKRDNTAEFRSYMVSEANARLATKNRAIILVETTKEMRAYIEAHPEKTQVAFIITTTPIHLARGLLNPIGNRPLSKPSFRFQSYKSLQLN